MITKLSILFVYFLTFIYLFILKKITLSNLGMFGSVCLHFSIKASNSACFTPGHGLWLVTHTGSITPPPLTPLYVNRRTTSSVQRVCYSQKGLSITLKPCATLETSSEMKCLKSSVGPTKPTEGHSVFFVGLSFCNYSDKGLYYGRNAWCHFSLCSADCQLPKGVYLSIYLSVIKERRKLYSG